jgi:hypothetical protein
MSMRPPASPTPAGTCSSCSTSGSIGAVLGVRLPRCCDAERRARGGAAMRASTATRYPPAAVPVPVAECHPQGCGSAFSATGWGSATAGFGEGYIG